MHKKSGSINGPFYQYEGNIKIVKEGDELDLGQGRVLEFYEVPNVHWPETMMTFEKNSRTLFPCDLFGTFGLFDGEVFDDNFDPKAHPFFEEEGRRYYSNVLATFSANVKKAVEKVETLPVEVIAPGHGLIWRQNPQTIIDIYKRYIGYSMGFGEKNEVTILWGSMYGMTEKAVSYAVEYLEGKGLTVHSHQLPVLSLSSVLMSALGSATLVVAAPTYEYNMFPPVATALDEIGRKRMSNRIMYCFGSHGWAAGTAKELKEISERMRMKWNVLDTYVFKGEADIEDYQNLESGLEQLVQEIQKL